MIQLFRKKERKIGKTVKAPKTVLCIPGNWGDRSEIVAAIAAHNKNHFLFAGRVLLNLQSSQGFELDIKERDEGMRTAFERAGKANLLSEGFLNEVGRHRFVIYISCETGDLKNAEALVEAGNAVLRSGGTGVKVEPAGKAFTKEQWTRLCADTGEANLYQMLVCEAMTDGKGNTFTCGMHHLGLKDTVVSQERFSDAVALISAFDHYRLMEKPEVAAGDTFCQDCDAPLFEILEAKGPAPIGRERFANPYGMWRLRRKTGR